jgi:hypothetical protein
MLKVTLTKKNFFFFVDFIDPDAGNLRIYIFESKNSPLYSQSYINKKEKSLIMRQKKT